MPSIYGCLSLNDKQFANEILVEQQKASLISVDSVLSNFAAYHCASIGGHDFYSAPSVCQQGQYLVIIEGSVHWLDEDLNLISQKHQSAQALVEGFFRYGAGVLKKMRGVFSLCLIDTASHYALLAIDPVGIRPLAYYFRDQLLVFGSQLEQIVAHPEVDARINTQAIFNYLYFHMIPSPDSIYQDIKKLQPGEFVELKDNKITHGFYWQVSYIDTQLPKKQLLEQLHHELLRSVKECKPDLQTGAFLSGGLDSSSVCGIYQEFADQPINAFSIGFDAEGYDEMAYARATARHFNFKLHEFYVTPAHVLEAIPLIAKAYDEPFGNSSAIPAYYCAKFAKSMGMNRLLAGDGGDEIFAGNSRYAKQKIFDLYRYIPGFAKAILEPLADQVPPLRKVKSYIEQAKLPMPERMETYNFLHRTPLAEIFSEPFLQQIEPSYPLELLARTYHSAPSDDLLKQMLFLDGKFTLADNDLRKVNHMCELAQIQVQYPMLQTQLVEFAASIPSNWLMQGFELRSFYRQGTKNFLAKETLTKSKQGFGLPFGVWMSQEKELKQFAESNLYAIAKRNILNPLYIKNLIKLHQEGHASYYGVMIWILVMLEQWFVSHSK